MTNPNPVAPKTDTPAMQELEPPIVEGLAPAEGRMCLCSQCVESVANYLRRAKCPVAAKMVTTLESTLAAERASRLQAEEALREASDALIDYQFQPVARILRARRIIDGALSNPSVSPEQAKEKE